MRLGSVPKEMGVSNPISSLSGTLAGFTIDGGCSIYGFNPPPHPTTPRLPRRQSILAKIVVAS